MTRLNIHRMKLYAQWQFACNRGILLKIIGMIASTFTIVFLFTTYVTRSSLLAQDSDLAVLLLSSFVFCGGLAFPGLSRKQGRTTQLMLPASNAEKFITNYIGVLLSSILAPTIAFIAADLVQWVISLILNYQSAILLTPLAFKYLFSTLFVDTNGFETSLFGALFFLWLHSFYLLGGIFFKKRHWLLTSIPLGALVSILGIILAGVGAVYVHILKQGDVYSIELLPWAEDVIHVGSYLFAFLLVALNYALAYRIFRRAQVINNRFFNW